MEVKSIRCSLEACNHTRQSATFKNMVSFFGHWFTRYFLPCPMFASMYIVLLKTTKGRRKAESTRRTRKRYAFRKVSSDNAFNLLSFTLSNCTDSSYKTQGVFCLIQFVTQNTLVSLFTLPQSRYLEQRKARRAQQIPTKCTLQPKGGSSDFPRRLVDFKS